MKNPKPSDTEYVLDDLPVVNATVPLQLTITAADIAAGTPLEPASCAVVRAGERELHTEMRVHTSRTYVKRGKHWLRYKTPDAMRAEIIAFDRGGRFIPGTFILGVPPDLATTRAYRQRHKRPNRPTQHHHRIPGIRTLNNVPNDD